MKDTSLWYDKQQASTRGIEADYGANGAYFHLGIIVDYSKGIAWKVCCFLFWSDITMIYKQLKLSWTIQICLVRLIIPRDFLNHWLTKTHLLYIIIAKSQVNQLAVQRMWAKHAITFPWSLDGKLSKLFEQNVEQTVK
jgi:hypothetical protein